MDDSRKQQQQHWLETESRGSRHLRRVGMHATREMLREACQYAYDQNMHTTPITAGQKRCPPHEALGRLLQAKQPTHEADAPQGYDLGSPGETRQHTTPSHATGCRRRGGRQDVVDRHCACRPKVRGCACACRAGDGNTMLMMMGARDGAAPSAGCCWPP